MCSEMVAFAVREAAASWRWAALLWNSIALIV